MPVSHNHARRWRALMLALLVVSISLLIFSAPVVMAQVLDRYTLPGDSVYPEGIAFQASTGDFFVSNTTDGSILRGNIARSQVDLFIPAGTEGLTGTRGLKVDNAGRLFAAAGPQGMIFVFNSADGALLNKFSTGVTPSFVNDVSIAPDGNAYFTDSQSPYLYRVMSDTQGMLVLEQWLTVSPTISYTQGFNLNGIAVTGDGRYLIVAQGNVGKLYRVETGSKSIAEIGLGGAVLTNTDGIWLDGQTLYLIRNSDNLLVTVDMGSDFITGTVRSSMTDPSFAYPTTLAKAGDRLLVVNSQFDKRGSNPTLPFTISSIAMTQTIPTTPTVTASPTATPESTPTVEPTATPEVAAASEPTPTIGAPTTLPAAGEPVSVGGAFGALVLLVLLTLLALMVARRLAT